MDAVWLVGIKCSARHSMVGRNHHSLMDHLLCTYKMIGTIPGNFTQRF